MWITVSSQVLVTVSRVCTTNALVSTKKKKWILEAVYLRQPCCFTQTNTTTKNGGNSMCLKFILRNCAAGRTESIMAIQHMLVWKIDFLNIPNVVGTLWHLGTSL